MKKTSNGHAVPVSELKARLSEYLRIVKAGGVVTITDRGRPVAVLSGVQSDAGARTRVDELVAAGLARAPRGKGLPADFWTRPRPQDPEGAGLAGLLEERYSGR